MPNTPTIRPLILILLTPLISVPTLKAEESSVDTEDSTNRALFSNTPGYAVFPEPHIQPGIGKGVSLIGSTINIEGTITDAYAVLWGGQVNKLVIGIADLHLEPEAANSHASDTLYGSIGWHQGENGSYQAIVSYRGVGAEENPFLAAKTYTLGINAIETKEDARTINYGYTLTVYQNTQRQGNDYAYVGHRVHGLIDKSLGERWSAYMSSNANLFLYSNADSFSQFQKKRVNLSLGLGGGVSFHLSAGLILFAGCDVYVQHSNLPRGFIYNQFNVIEGIQGASLGSYTTSSVNFGARYNF